MTIFCNPSFGDDETAVAGDLARPFKTQRAAMAAAREWMLANNAASCHVVETHRQPPPPVVESEGAPE